MPQVFAYLHVSTDAQNVANQKKGVVRYCVDKRLLEPVFVEDPVSCKSNWKDRQLGKMIRGAGKGDVIVVSEVSRQVRSTLEVLEIGRECFERGAPMTKLWRIGEQMRLNPKAMTRFGDTHNEQTAKHIKMGHTVSRWSGRGMAWSQMLAKEFSRNFKFDVLLSVKCPT